jgi:hypothetical protein
MKSKPPSCFEFMESEKIRSNKDFSLQIANYLVKYYIVRISEGQGSFSSPRKESPKDVEEPKKGGKEMKKRKRKWLTGGATLIIILGLALSAGWAKEKKWDLKKIFKPKTEEPTEAEIKEPEAVEPVEAEPAMEVPEVEDWTWEEEPVKIEPEPTAVAPPLVQPQQHYRLHKVGAGENLHLLAAYYYGDARTWPRIYQVNKKTIRNPNLIREGQILKIEVPPGWKPRFELAEFMEKEKKRQEAIAQAPLEKPTIVREQRTVLPTIMPLPELEEEVEAERGEAPLRGIEGAEAE